MEPILYLLAFILLLMIGGMAWVVRDAESREQRAIGAGLWFFWCLALFLLLIVLGFSTWAVAAAFLAVSALGYSLPEILNFLFVDPEKAPKN